MTHKLPHRRAARRPCGSAKIDFMYLHSTWCESSVRNAVCLHLVSNFVFAKEYIVNVSAVLSPVCAKRCVALYGLFVVFSAKHLTPRVNYWVQ